jgi:hypothetical protein
LTTIWRRLFRLLGNVRKSVGTLCRFDQQDATPGHGVARIEGHVQERGLDLSDINQDRPEVACQSLPNFDGGTQ